jgi:CBS domain-containing protein
MNTVRKVLARKNGAIIHVRSGDMVVEALRQMRDNRVRSVLVIDDDALVGIVTQGDCAIKVLLPGLDAKQTPVGQVMTRNPVTVKPDDQLEGCMTMMASRGFRHLPVTDAGKVVGVISIGDVVKDIIHGLERNVGDLMGYIMTDGPGG